MAVVDVIVSTRVNRYKPGLHPVQMHQYCCRRQDGRPSTVHPFTAEVRSLGPRCMLLTCCSFAAHRQPRDNAPDFFRNRGFLCLLLPRPNSPALNQTWSLNSTSRLCLFKHRNDHISLHSFQRADMKWTVAPPAAPFQLQGCDGQTVLLCSRVRTRP